MPFQHLDSLANKSLCVDNNVLIHCGGFQIVFHKIIRYCSTSTATQCQYRDLKDRYQCWMTISGLRAFSIEIIQDARSISPAGTGYGQSE